METTNHSIPFFDLLEEAEQYKACIKFLYRVQAQIDDADYNTPEDAQTYEQCSIELEAAAQTLRWWKAQII